MPDSKSSPAPPEPNAAAQAFEALKTYDRGSGRAALLPIDQAVAVASVANTPARKELEQQLITALRSGSVVAREYVCSKLLLIGSGRSASALGELLGDAQLATAARSALEAIPGPEAALALRGGLARLSGPGKVGAINSLGNRRDAASTEALIELLRDNDAGVVAAAAAALGNIGSAKAAEALGAFCPKAPEALRNQAADAALNCGEHLLKARLRTEARALYGIVANQQGLPPFIVEAAQRGLRACA